MKIPLQRERVARRRFGVDAESRLTGAPRVGGVSPVRKDLFMTIEVLAVHTKKRVRPQSGAIAAAHEVRERRASADFCERALRVLRALRDDVDDAVDRVRAPEGA